MFNDFLIRNINNGTYADYIPDGVEVGYAQVEPNHLSAQRNSQVYAQLPAAANIEILQQGQFVKYDYANGEVNFGDNANGFEVGEWMLVYNEIKLYREFQNDCEFAMIKDNYEARVYSPFGGAKDGSGPDVVDYNGQGSKQTRYYNLQNQGYTFPAEYEPATEYAANTTYYTKDGDTYTEATVADADAFAAGTFYVQTKAAKTYAYDEVTADADYYEPHYNKDPFHIETLYKEQMMKEGTKMVPRVFKTMVGDIFTTNAVLDDIDTLAVGDVLKVDTSIAKKKGFLKKNGNDTSGMKWQVVKIYTMPDHQKGIKVMRIA